MKTKEKFTDYKIFFFIEEIHFIYLTRVKYFFFRDVCLVGKYIKYGHTTY